MARGVPPAAAQSTEFRSRMASSSSLAVGVAADEHEAPACCVCSEETALRQLDCCGKGFVCDGCLGRWIQAKAPAAATCPLCTCPLPQSAVRQVLDEAQWQRYLSHSLALAAAGSTTLHTCPTPDCDGVVFYEPPVREPAATHAAAAAACPKCRGPLERRHTPPYGQERDFYCDDCGVHLLPLVGQPGEPPFGHCRTCRQDYCFLCVADLEHAAVPPAAAPALGRCWTCSCCQRTSCLLCRAQPFHDGKSCEAAAAEARRAAGADAENEELSLRLLHSSCQSCPKCGMAVTKIAQTCNKLECRCGARWCWKCGAEADGRGRLPCTCTGAEHVFWDNRAKRACQSEGRPG